MGGCGLPVAAELVAARAPFVDVGRERGPWARRVLVQVESAGQKRCRVCNLALLERNAAAPVEELGAIAGVEPWGADERLGVDEHLGGTLELAAVHLAPGEGEVMPECEGDIAAHLGPELFQTLDRLVVPARGDELLRSCER